LAAMGKASEIKALIHLAKTFRNLPCGSALRVLDATFEQGICVGSIAEERFNGFKKPIRVALMQHRNFQTFRRTRARGDPPLALIIFIVNCIDFRTVCAYPIRYILPFLFAWPGPCATKRASMVWSTSNKFSRSKSTAKR